MYEYIPEKFFSMSIALAREHLTRRTPVRNVSIRCTLEISTGILYSVRSLCLWYYEYVGEGR